MSESNDDGEHSDWTLLQAENADALLQTQVDNGDEEKEKEPSAIAMADQLSTVESSGIEEDHVDEDGDDEARSDTTASIHSNFCHIHPDELLDAEVQSEASADSISVIPDDQDLHMDLSNFSSFSSANCELPTDLNVTRQRAYTHVPNRKLNITLNLVLALSFAMVVGLGIGHFLGWSTKWEQTVATIQTMKVQELHDDLIECMSRPVTQDDDHDNACPGEFHQGSDMTEVCQATSDSGVDEELLEEFNELKRSLHTRQQELETAMNTIEEAQMKERSSLDRLRQLEEENQELKSLVDEEMANDQMEDEMAEKLRSENVQLKEDLARLQEELAAEMAEDEQFGQQDYTNDAVVGSFREQMNQLEIENADLRQVIARLRYVDHPNVMDHREDPATEIPIASTTQDQSPDSEAMDISNPETPPSKDASFADLLRNDDLNSILEDFLAITKQKYYRDGQSHISLMEGLKAYKSVFAKIASMSSSLNGEQIVGKVETTLRDSLDTLEKMGMDIKSRLSEIWLPNKQDVINGEEGKQQQVTDDVGNDEVNVEETDVNIPQQGDSANNEANSNNGKWAVKTEKENEGMAKVNEKKQSKEKEKKISKEKDSSKILKEQNQNKASKEKEKTKISKEKDNKVSKENDKNKVSKENDIKNKVSEEKDNNKVSKGKESKIPKKKENSNASHEKDKNKVSKEKDNNKVSKERHNNKVSKERDNNKVSKEKESKIQKKKENSNPSNEVENNRVSKTKENNKMPKEKDSNKIPEMSKKREKSSDTKRDRKQRGSEKTVKNSKDKKETMSKTQNKDGKQHTKKSNKDTGSEDAKNKRNKKKSQKSSENSTESSGGTWMFERANQRETKRNKDREADWYFERKHREHIKEAESKKYADRKKKHNEDDDDDEKMKYSKDWEKDKKKGKNYHRTRDCDEDDDDRDGDEHCVNWYTKMAKSFQKYKKIVKRRWSSFQENWDIPHSHNAKVPHVPSYFEQFYKSH